MSWEEVDQGWGRKAADFAALAEPSNCREYVFMHSQLDLGPEHHVLDVACGAGLAVELARYRGATCAGIDASNRLVDIARFRNPGVELVAGDMNALPWADSTFDIVTSFRGIWGTTPDAIAEVARVLKPGGRVAMTVWGNVGKSPGAWVFEPFQWAARAAVEEQAAMVSLGRPGVGEAFLADAGLVPAERFTVPFALEFPDPETFARGMAASGPAFQAIEDIGEEAFLQRATKLGRTRVQEGLPLRAEVELFGYLATKPG